MLRGRCVPRDFLKLWVGQSVSLVGSEVTLLAMPLVAVLALGASASEMGILRALQFAPEVLALPAGFAAIAVAVGFGHALFGIGLATLGQAFSPPDVLGRTTASRRFLLVGVVPFGALVGGALGEAIGARAALLVAGIGLLFTSVWLAWSPIRSLRAL